MKEKFIPATEKQRMFIDKLSHGEIDTSTLSLSQAKRDIRELLQGKRSAKNFVEKHNYKFLVKNVYKELRERGAKVGSHIRVLEHSDPNWGWGWISNLTEKKILICFHGEKGRYNTPWRSHWKIVGLENPASVKDLNLWCHVGFIEVKEGFIKQLTEKERDLLIRRDSFLSNSTLFFISQHIYDVIIERLKIEEEEINRKRKEKIKVYREKMDHRFCVTCGKEIVRPDGMDLSLWSHQSRCDDCKENQVVRGSVIFCQTCGSAFEVEGYKRNCQKCRQ
jgi:ribosomal protein S27E